MIDGNFFSFFLNFLFSGIVCFPFFFFNFLSPGGTCHEVVLLLLLLLLLLLPGDGFVCLLFRCFEVLRPSGTKKNKNQIGWPRKRKEERASRPVVDGIRLGRDQSET